MVKLAIFASLAVGGAAASARTHTTNTIHSYKAQTFPLDRPGHVRRSNTSCLQERDMESRMMTQHLAEHKEANRAEMRAKGLSPMTKSFVSDVKCTDGMAGEYACKGVDLLSFVPISEMGSTREASDSWGWTDPDTGDEVAIICFEDSTAFVQITDPLNPVVLGNLKQSGDSNRIWSDVKVYANHAFIIREVNHGVQVFDMTALRDLYDTPSPHVRQLTEDLVYRDNGLTSSHNIVINEETAFAYSVGSTTCRGGLHAIDISEPKNPQFAGCFSDDGYTHDAQIVIYSGPDTRYVGKEIAFNFNENTMTIVDVSDKGNMVQLSRTPYERNMYTHQGWLTEDMQYVISNDELDESYGFGDQEYTRSLLWDVTDLEAPVFQATHTADVKSIDHNLYIKGDRAYLANYVSGLRIVDASSLEGDSKGEERELGFFDTAPYASGTNFNGAWSNYPYFASGSIVVSNIETGLFILKESF